MTRNDGQQKARFGTMGGWFLVALLLTCGAFPAPARAQDPDLGWRPGNYMAQAVAAVMASARKVSDVTSYGYDRNGNCFLAAFVKPSDSVTIRVPLTAGKSYLFLGGGDNQASDVDLEVLDDAGNPVAQDHDQDASPLVPFVPIEDGMYSIRLVLAASERASFCGIAILVRGGYDVPVTNLAAATAKFLGAAAAISQRSPDGAKFHDAPNQWAIYGSVLEPGQAATVVDLTPGKAALAYVSAGDSVARDIDLYLLDDHGAVLAKDTDPDALPLVLYRTGEQPTNGLRTKLEASDGGRLSLVITGVLEF